MIRVNNNYLYHPAQHEDYWITDRQIDRKREREKKTGKEIDIQKEIEREKSNDQSR